jgi:hypothetical protein|tara:strand:+ start:131 stop:331 length:201 start_codon:yes stop_codon:yes gene_type:complete
MAKHSARYIMRQQKKLDKKLRRKPKNINADGDTTMMPLHQTITLDHLTKPKVAPGEGFEPSRSPKQ